MDFVKGLENELDCTLTNRTLTRLIVHTACMVERLLFHEYSFEQNAGTSEYLKTQKRLHTAVSNNLQGNCFGLQYYHQSGRMLLHHTDFNGG